MFGLIRRRRGRIGVASCRPAPIAIACLFSLAAPIPLARGGENRPLEIEVAAGARARRDTPVSIELPAVGSVATLQETIPSLQEIGAGDPRPVPCQIEPASRIFPARLHWILDGETPAGAIRRFRLDLRSEGAPPPAGRLTLAGDGKDFLEVRLDGKGIFRYRAAPVPPSDPKTPAVQTRSAYLHPLWSPSGKVLTMDYPPNHLHHRGVWFPWTKTEFEGRHPDFWNLGTGTGTVAHEAMLRQFSGPVVAGFAARHRHLDLQAPEGPKAALVEEWTVRAYAVGGERAGYFIFDLESHQECAGASPLRLAEYLYGGLALRGSWDWEGDRARVFTSEGKGRLNGEGERARWIDLSGPVEGGWGGIAILGHPSNFRAPQPVRVHPTEPYLNFGPVKAGPFEIVPGKPYVSRYRFYLHDGVLQADEAERLWGDFAEPPAVKRTK